MTLRQGLTVNDYTVGIICALHNELRAARYLLDDVHPDIQLSSRDTNYYALGRMGSHNVVMTCLPASEYGTNAAASVASQMYISFPVVQFALLVGIAGGAPSEVDVRLGDVVVGLPTGMRPGVIQYDMGKVIADGSFKETGYLQKPSPVLLSAVERLRTDPSIPRNPLQTYLDAIAQRDSRYGYPGKNRDILYRADCSHELSSGNQQCRPVQRQARNFEYPYIHHGLIASGNRVIKNAHQRDLLAKRHNILCFEMEAAGIMNAIPCLVIRGICDYADCHKNKAWQEYASASAAAYAKLLLSRTRPYQPPWARTAGPYNQASHHLSNPRPNADASHGTTGSTQHRLQPVQPVQPSEQLASHTRHGPTGVRSARDILRKAESYAESSGLWNPVPADATPIMAAFKEWAERRVSDVLIVEPETWDTAPRAEAFAFEATCFLRFRTQPTMWALWPEYEEPLTMQDITYCLAEQAKWAGIQDAMTVSNGETRWQDTLSLITDRIDNCFFVVQVKDCSLATSLLKSLQTAFRQPNRTVKLLLISYWPEASILARKVFPRIKTQRLSPPLPAHEMRRSSVQWWDIIEPRL